ncbi:T3SS (YopN, CesT) and YbjN peptide-binding chaperone 1 [Acaryochloris sp. CCMEE 5410]|uniref:T3SS (YopN, CesT) and YbjN peptide-binding chaperone 1 n=1 Tax=Acaryochloris sp. CCMEE 5410 TaxID=310037 RepID=UPI00024852DD|nr:YbjN domain-containing protein [Acaryochloris sp. CCMEE 5410]KAI9135165.1 YbjN domain-containing protein [Acaryochloris sp. CCMEE 5410]
MEFQTQAQQECHTKVASWMDELFEDIPWEKLDDPGFGLFMGSAWVEVRVFPWQEDSVINIRSTVVSGANMAADLQSHLLRENAEMRFGAFSVNDAGDILFEHTIVGSTCDPNELEASVHAVLAAADNYDDQIVQRWGGERALDRNP